MLNIEQETQELLAAYKAHTELLMKEVELRGVIINRLLEQLEDARQINALLGG